MADIRPRANASFPHLRLALALIEATATVGHAEMAVALATETVAHSETHETTLPVDTATEVVLLLAATATTADTEGGLTASAQTDTVAKTDAVAIGALVPVAPNRASPKPAEVAAGEALAPATATEPQSHLHHPRTMVDVIITVVRVCRKAIATLSVVPHRDSLALASTDPDVLSERAEVLRTTSMRQQVETMKPLSLVHLEDHGRILSAELLSDAQAPVKTMNCILRAPMLHLESGPLLADQCPVTIWPSGRTVNSHLDEPVPLN